MVGMLIMGIARAENVTLLLILESVSGYLLLGLCLSIMVALFVLFDPYSFNFQNLSNNITPNINQTSNYIYYTIVSLTSTGYGDFLPLTPAAKSLSNLISISGQLYIAIIIAMIVGKYLNKR
jgi:voltage-gated potassium channel